MKFLNERQNKSQNVQYIQLSGGLFDTDRK